jgi:hypothetical protein
MVAVLCEVADLPALWAARGLERRGVRVEVIGAPLLACALEWEHRIGGDGVSVSIRLADGRELSSAEPAGVLNRLSIAPSGPLEEAGGADRDYARQELHALFLSWLSALPGPVVNRPTPQGLCGHWRRPSAWAALAARAGLPVLPWRSADDSDRAPWPGVGTATVFVVGGRTIAPAGGAPEWVLASCGRLAESSGELLLALELVPLLGWAFATASVTPDLSLGGEPLLDALQAVLAA